MDEDVPVSSLTNYYVYPLSSIIEIVLIARAGHVRTMLLLPPCCINLQS